jgi:hypothetical protein
MQDLLNQKEFTLKEGKRFIRGLRKYEVFSGQSNTALFTIAEEGGIFKKIMRGLFGESISSMSFNVSDAQGNSVAKIKKGLGVSNVSIFKLLDKNGNMISSAGNPIKFNDDSFIEIKDANKTIIFKSGLTGGSQWFPILVFPAENVKADWLRGTLSGTKYAQLGRTDNNVFSSSGNSYQISFGDEPKTVEELLNIITFSLCADFYYDNRR